MYIFRTEILLWAPIYVTRKTALKDLITIHPMFSGLHLLFEDAQIQGFVANLIYFLEQISISKYLTHITDTQHVEGGHVERFDVEFLRPQGLYDDRLPCSGQVCHGEVSGNRKS